MTAPSAPHDAPGRTDGRALVVLVPGAPDPALSPNRRFRAGGHHAGTRAARQARSDAFIVGIQARSFGAVPTIEGPFRIEAVIAWPSPRRPLDFDNAVGALKPYLDGLADAFVIADDRQLTGMDIEQRRADRGDRAGWVSLTVREGTAT